MEEEKRLLKELVEESVVLGEMKERNRIMWGMIEILKPKDVPIRLFDEVRELIYGKDA